MGRFARRLGLLMGIAVLAAPPSASASYGTDFWLGFPDALDGTAPAHRLLITAPDGASGTASIPGSPFNEGFNVGAGGVTTVTLPPSIELTAADSVTASRGVHVTSDRQISVRASYESPGAGDGYLGLATSALGTEYRVVDFPGNVTCGKAQFEVLGTQADTTVTITPTTAIGSHPAETPYEIDLDAGAAYLGQATGTAATNGTKIAADRPIAVLAGNSCGQVPSGGALANFLVEQIPPVSALGTSFSVLPFAGRAAADEMTIVGSQAGTSVTVTGAMGPIPGAPAGVGAGQSATFSMDESIRIVASKPVLVAHFARGGGGTETGDPTMVLVPPSQHHSHSQMIATPASGFSQRYVNVTLASADIGSLRLDGAAVPAASFSPVGADSSISGAALPIGPGAHVLSSDGPVGAEVYGFGTADAFGWMGGWGDGSRAPQPAPIGGPAVPASPLAASARCRVPKLKRKKLRAVKKALRRAGCRLGKVRKRKGASAKNGRVVAQKPRPGKSLPAKAKVTVTLDD